MADDAASTSTEETQLTFNVKPSDGQKYVVTVAANSTVADLKAKLSTSEFADLPAERQRLIYSGRVLKDPDTLASYKIKDGHTVHLVKGAASNARQNPANQGSGSNTSGTGTPSQVPSNLATGTGNNPLAGLTGARYAGFHGLPGLDTFGPDGGMGPPPDADQLLELMENPMFVSQMNEAMNNPAVIEMMTQNPMFRNNPMVAEMIRNPEMRRMLFNPEMIRMQLQMQRAMGGGGGGGGGGQRMAAPGVTDNTPGSTATGGESTATPNQPNTTGPTQQQDPFAALLGAGAGGAGANPFANLFGTPGAFGQPPNQNNAGNTGSDANAGSTEGNRNTSSPPPNPFAGLFGAPPGVGGQQQANPIADMTARLMQNPEAMQAALNMFGQMGGGGGGFGAPSNPSTGNTGTPGTTSPPPNPFASLFGPGAFGAGGFGTPPPQDNRPPEEVYEVQLRQLNEMGFYDFERNVSALRRSGGNVQGAIEFLFSGSS